MILSISALRYRLLDSIPCLEPLRILQRRDACWQGWQVRCYVLGASHAVCLEREGAHLTELLTCLPPGGTLQALAEAAADRPGDVYVAAHGLICRACLAPFALSEGDALREDFPAAGRLEVAYPCAAGAQPAFTRLGWHDYGERLRVETVHTYPEEGRGVRTQTEFIQSRKSPSPWQGEGLRGEVSTLRFDPPARATGRAPWAEGPPDGSFKARRSKP